MTDKPDAHGSPLSEDQIAVAEYFASDRYQRSKVSKDPTRQPVPTHASPLGEQIRPGLTSFFAGLSGLAAITFVFAVAFPIGIKLLEDLTSGKPAYLFMMFIVQTMFFPPMVGFAFATVGSMFWYGSIALRFVIATLAVLPGCVGFLVAMTWLEESGPRDFYYAFAMVMFTSFVATAAVALTVQIWSRWTLTHARIDGSALPVPGIRSMIELTGIAAIGFSIFASNDIGDIIDGILFFGAFGLLASAAIISVLIGFLGGGGRRRPAAMISACCAFCVALLPNGFFAVVEYGWDALSTESLLIAGASLYGAALIGCLMWLCVRWLHFCGWRCIHRTTERQRPET